MACAIWRIVYILKSSMSHAPLIQDKSQVNFKWFITLNLGNTKTGGKIFTVNISTHPVNMGGWGGGEK